LNNKPAKTFFLLVIVIITSIALMNLIADKANGSSVKSISAGDVISGVHGGSIESIEWQETRLRGKYRTGGKFTANYVKPSEPAAVTLTDLIREVNTKGGSTPTVKLTILDPPASLMALSILGIIAFPLMLVALIYFLVLRPTQMRGP
jgi:hypothetical protein